MKNKNIKVLLLSSNFTGGFRAFDVFIEVIKKHFDENHIDYRYANNVVSAAQILKTENISFSINVGLYKYYDSNIPLYEIYHIHNYQWIMDNPLKLNIDFKSKYNHPIFIDKDFAKLVDSDINYLCLPMIFPDLDEHNEIKEDAILTPLKIRNLLDIKEDIDRSEDKDNIYSFISSFDYDKCYIDAFIEYKNTHSIKNEYEFFKLTNSYIRTDKRIRIINSIHSKPIYLLSSIKNPLINNPNVTYIEASDFEKTFELMKKYKYVLSISPNYDKALHERASYALSKGAIVLSDYTSLFNELGFPGTISYHSLDNIDEMINKLDKNTHQKQWKLIEKYSFENIFKALVEHYLKQNEL